jgi:hypothetical protein
MVKVNFPNQMATITKESFKMVFSADKDSTFGRIRNSSIRANSGMVFSMAKVFFTTSLEYTKAISKKG